MKIVRFASASDGGSQFVEVDIPIDNVSTDAFGNTVRRSAILPAQSTMVTEMPEGFYQDWHPASRRQLLIVLAAFRSGPLARFWDVRARARSRSSGGGS